MIRGKFGDEFFVPGCVIVNGTMIDPWDGTIFVCVAEGWFIVFNSSLFGHGKMYSKEVLSNVFLSHDSPWTVAIGGRRR